MLLAPVPAAARDRPDRRGHGVQPRRRRAAPVRHGPSRHELRAIVRDGIAALPEKHRSVVVLYYLQRLSLQETAEVLGIQLGTVKSRLHYALRGLRDHLERDRRFGGAYRAPASDEVEANAS